MPYSLTKSIEARKLNPKTGAVLPGPDVTVPFGALVDKIERDRDMAKFRYLGVLHGCPHDVLMSALEEGEASAEAPRASAPAGDGATAKRRVHWEKVESNGPAMLRTRVPGGWLVCVGEGLTFYPDPDHAWEPGA